LLPATPEAAEAAWRDAERELARLRELRLIKAATAWLEARPQWGQDVFTRPRRGRDPRVASYMQLMEACLTLLEREEEDAGDVAVYQPPARRLFSIPDALARIRAALAGLTDPMPLMNSCHACRWTSPIGPSSPDQPSAARCSRPWSLRARRRWRLTVRTGSRR
jgi:hypothetical protein